ncbi:hypothetical protein ACUODJ_48965, partial [Escherichia sp. HC-CC]
ASFYAVKESKTNKDSYIQLYDIRQALLQKSNEELITIICDILNQYPEMETKLLFQHASDYSDVNSCSQIINEYIHAVQGAELVLEKVDQTAAGNLCR